MAGFGTRGFVQPGIKDTYPWEQIDAASQVWRQGLMASYQKHANIRSWHHNTKNHNQRAITRQPDLLPFISSTLATAPYRATRKAVTINSVVFHSLWCTLLLENHSFVSLFPFDFTIILDIYHFIEKQYDDVKIFLKCLCYFWVLNMRNLSSLVIPVGPEIACRELRSLGQNLPQMLVPKPILRPLFASPSYYLTTYHDLALKKLDCWYRTDLHRHGTQSDPSPQRWRRTGLVALSRMSLMWTLQTVRLSRKWPFNRFWWAGLNKATKSIVGDTHTVWYA